MVNKRRKEKVERRKERGRGGEGEGRRGEGGRDVLLFPSPEG